MKITPITSADLARSVIAVPPLCRNSDWSLCPSENRRLIQYLEAGGVRILLYGGNANFYHLAVSEYAEVLDFLAEAAGEDTLMIPSAGPSYGNLMDQAEVLRERSFPAAMILPMTFPVTLSGVQTGVRRFVERSSVKAVLYIKDEQVFTPGAVAELVADGLVSWIKYAVVREDPKVDPFLRELTERVDPNMIVSGIGEQPAPVHLRDFQVVGFTSGCVCVAPAASMEMLRALKAGDDEGAESWRAKFQGLEDLRNGHGPIPVLHHAVALAGIAETGPPLPLLGPLEEGLLSTIEPVAKALKSLDPCNGHS